MVDFQPIAEEMHFVPARILPQGNVVNIGEGMKKPAYSSLDSLLTDVYNGVGKERVKKYAQGTEYGALELKANNSWLRRVENADRTIREYYTSLEGRVDTYEVEGTIHLLDQYITKVKATRKGKIQKANKVLKQLRATKKYLLELKERPEEASIQAPDTQTYHNLEAITTDEEPIHEEPPAELIAARDARRDARAYAPARVDETPGKSVKRRGLIMSPAYHEIPLTVDEVVGPVQEPAAAHARYLTRPVQEYIDPRATWLPQQPFLPLPPLAHKRGARALDRMLLTAAVVTLGVSMYQVLEPQTALGFSKYRFSEPATQEAPRAPQTKPEHVVAASKTEEEGTAAKRFQEEVTFKAELEALTIIAEEREPLFMPVLISPAMHRMLKEIPPHPGSVYITNEGYAREYYEMLEVLPDGKKRITRKIPARKATQ